jgi:putative glutamine amidotransferase
MRAGQTCLDGPALAASAGPMIAIAIMTEHVHKPLIGIPACVRILDDHPFHVVGEKYITAVTLGADGVPLIVPSLGAAHDIDDLVDRLDGLLVTGSPSNVDPALYGASLSRPESPSDPARDATTLPLIRRAIQVGLPVFGICRGIQELNVALGGTLHQEVHNLPGKLDHRALKDVGFDARYAPRHGVELVAGGALAGLLGKGPIMVNSLHWQAIDRVAEPLRIEGTAPDGVIEAVSARDAPGFVLAVQWHPEYRIRENPVSVALFAAFGEAARSYAAARRRDRGATGRTIQAA